MSVIRRRQPAEVDRSEDTMPLTDEPSNIKGDELNIIVLLILYLLQGIPLGLTSAIPMLLQTRGASFKQQAEFSFVYWPFSLKLLWAPIVDSVYSTRFGRRKTWLVPIQYLIALFMLFLSFQVESWLGRSSEEGGEEPQVALLTFLFFVLNFLAATQDIAVDGWALTMLKRRNVGYASTCNSVGQTAGYFLGFVIFIALESSEFCNNYLRSEPLPDGIVTLPGFLYFWGIVYAGVTTLVALFKHEAEGTSSPPSHPLLAAASSYKQLFKILFLPTVRSLALVLLTVKIGFAATDAVSSLKLIERGVPKDKMALLAVPLVPLQIMLPVVLAKYHKPSRPLNMYIKVIPYRLAFNVVAALFVSITPWLVHGKGIPTYYYLLFLVVTSIHQVTIYCMFVEAMTFFAKISDPIVGGTNMTLLNTLNNLGGTWSSTVALWFVDLLTWKSCSNSSDNDCSTSHSTQVCVDGGGSCETTFDGFYLETIILTGFGALWYMKSRRILDYLQTRPLSDWHSR